jgi:hypothetical protein
VATEVDSMRINRDEPIHGLRPSVLKALFRRQQFNTPTAMRLLGLDEPEVSRRLAAMAADDWIGLEETHDYVDFWLTKPKASRLVASRLLKRFPVAEGRRIAAAVVAEACAINADPSFSHCCTALFLFGSILTADDSADAGDINLMVEIRRRTLSPKMLDRIESAEMAQASDAGSPIQRLFWPQHRILSRLKSISNKISLHGPDDLKIVGARFRQIYAYNPAVRREVPFDATERRFPAPCEAAAVEALTFLAPSRAYCDPVPWPPLLDTSADIHISSKAAAAAQHMWVNGASMAAITAATHVEAEVIQAYLASRCLAGSRAPLVLDASLLRTVGQRLAPGRGYTTFVKIEICPGRQVIVDVGLHDPVSGERLASIRRMDNDWHINGARPNLVADLEALLQAASAWTDRLLDRVGAQGLRVTLVILPDETPTEPSSGMSFMDFRPLAAPLTEALRAAVRTAGGSTEPYTQHRAQMCLHELLAVIYIRQSSGVKRRRRLRGATAAVALVAGNTFREKWNNVLKDGGSFAVFVTDRMLKAMPRDGRG